MKKVLIITNIISPYRIPLFNHINTKGDFKFKVIALAANEKNRNWKVNKNKIEFNYDTLKGISFFIQKKDWPIHINYGLHRMIRQYDPDVLITSGYDSIAYWEAFLYSKLYNKKFILWNGSTLLSSKENTGIIAQFKKFIIKHSDRYITYGSKSKEYLENYNAKKRDINVGLNTVNIDYFYFKVEKYRNTNLYLQERAKYPKIIFLFVGQFIERKGIKELIDVAEKINNKDVGFIIVGDGPLKKNLERFVKKHNLKNIYFTGFIQKNNLYKYYSMADVLVVPSKEEVWGLVVNEGLASGNYIIASDQVGSVYDVIKDNRFGKIYSYDERSNGLKKSLDFCINNIKNIRKNRNLRSEYARNNLNIERYAQSFLDAINSLN